MKPETTLDLFPDERQTGEAPLTVERACWRKGYRRVAGVDEAGRGSLSGPVVAAAVVFPVGVRVEGVTDSKRLSATRRDVLAEDIRKRALAVGVGSCSPAEIDSMNILNAAMEAMRRAVLQLDPEPDFLLIDGNRSFPGPSAPVLTIVKGDARSHAIAAASIIAKTTRDAWMHELHEAYPEYGWSSNMGYATAAHYRALARHGATPHHRRTFRLF